MKVSRFWATEEATSVDADGIELRTSAWGWSSSSLDEAKSRAKATAERVARWLAGLDDTAPHESRQYQYLLDRPPREEIIQEFRDADGETAALITRNKYGSLVLNCRDLMFVDVDFPPPPFWRALWAWIRRRKPQTDDLAADVTARVRTWCVANANIPVRLYQTAAGLRLAIVDRPMQAGRAEARRILEELGSDPLYQRLCDAQQCFRARLSPKPWRVGVKSPDERFPYQDEASEQAHRDWLQTYESAASGYSTCQLVEVFGPPNVDSTLAPLVELHDAMTGASNRLPLA